MAKAKKTSGKQAGPVVQRLMQLFAGYESVHGTHGEPERDPNGLKWNIKKTARTFNASPTEEMWAKHVAGERPLGIVPIRENNTCGWGSIDVDKYNLNLLAVVQQVEAAGLPLVPCRSKSGGLHLFLFLCEPLPAAQVQIALRNLAAQLGFADSEIFPKQTQILVDQGDSGSWMVMPYFGGTYGGKLKEQVGLKKTGAEMTLEEFVAAAEAARVTEQTLTELKMRSVPAEDGGTARPKAAKGAKGSSAKVPFGDGPPCLQFLAESGFPEGGRNNALFHLGVYLKRADPLNWKAQLELDNQKYMKPPLPSEEVAGVKKSLDKKDYEYKCKDQPMVGHCDSILCRTRRYGVGNEIIPHINAIRKVQSENPMWFMDVDGPNGVITICMSTTDAQRYEKFHAHCMDAATVGFKALPNAVWMSILSEAVNNRTEVIIPPADMRAGGMFGALLEQFLTGRGRGNKKDDLLRGVPWEDEEAGRHYFRLNDLKKFLDREGMKLSNNDIIANVKRMHNGEGGEDHVTDPKFHPHVFVRVKDRGVNAWWVPSTSVQRPISIDPPEMPREEI